MDAKGVAMPSGALEGGHGASEAAGDELRIEDRPVPEDWEPLRQASQARREGLMPLPVPDFTTPVPRLHDPVGSEDDQPANTVDLRLDRVPLGLGNRREDGAWAVIRHELRKDLQHHTRVPLVGATSLTRRARVS